MKPELKFGRKVIAWEDNVDPVKGRYIKYGSHEQEHWILDDTGSIMPFQHAKLDPEGEPINGDEVEGAPGDWLSGAIFGTYVGVDKNGHHVIDNRSHGLVRCVSVRLPQPSKREMVIEFLNSYYYPCNAEKIADQIEQIYTEGL